MTLAMAKHIWSIVCRQAIVDRFTNSLSLIDAMEGFEIAIQPIATTGKAIAAHVVTGVDFVVVSHWMRTKSDEPEDAWCERADLFFA
jgi:hypothetical protein